MSNKNNLNFSFSGLKTAVRKIAENPSSQFKKTEIANEFQNAILDCLLEKCSKAIDIFRQKYGLGYFVMSGGVASNSFLREGLQNLTEQKKMHFFAPEPKLCVDNASMIAWAGIEKILSNNLTDDIEILPAPRWSLVELGNE